MAGDVASMAAEMTPYVSAAVGAYGGAVLARVRDDAADATVGLGRRLLQRVFGSQAGTEPLPAPLEALAADPGDGDALAAVRLAIRQVLAADPVLAGEVRSMLAAAPGVFQQAHAGRDAYTAARDMTVIHHHAADTGQPQQPGLIRPVPGAVSGRVVAGDIPQQPPAFQLRETLLPPLHGQADRSSDCLIYVITGMPGAGKTQAAAAYARQCIADKWQLVAWVYARDGQSILDGLSQAAISLGISVSGDEQAAAAAALRHWLEVRGERCLLVFDNANNPDELRPYLPASGRAQVVITSTRQALSSLGIPVPADVFTESEALAYLSARTGIHSSEGAYDLAKELGRLPLALAQAAAVIAAQRLSYQTYLDRLRASSIGQYLTRPAEDPYPLGAAGAILLSLQAAQDGDAAAMAASVMDIIALLSEAGVPRDLFHTAGTVGLLGSAGQRPAVSQNAQAKSTKLTEIDNSAAVDAVIARLADASVLTFSVDWSTVSSHNFIMRVIREQHEHNGSLPAATATAIALLQAATDAAEPVWQHYVTAKNLIQQITALTSHLGGLVDHGDRQITEDLLGLRGWALRCQAELGDNFTQAIRLGESLVADCEQVLGRNDPETLAARSNLASAYGDARRMEDSIGLGEMALADCERVLGSDDPLTLATRSNLAKSCEWAHRLEDAADLSEQALADCERVLGCDDPLTLATRSILADVYVQKGQLAEAVALYEQNLADSERVLCAEHPHILRSRTDLALAYAQAGQPGKAIALHKRVLADREQTLGVDHPYTLLSRHNLADAYAQAGRLTDAITLLERTVADRERVLGPDHPDTLTSRNNLAGTYFEAGHLGRAIELHERTLADRERVFGPDHFDTLTSRNNLAGTYLEAKRLQESVAMYELTVDGLQRVLGPVHPNTLVSQGNLAVAYLRAGLLKEATALFKRTLRDYEPVLGRDHPDTKAVREILEALCRRRP